MQVPTAGVMYDAFTVLIENLLADITNPEIAAVLKQIHQDPKDPTSPTEYQARLCALREDAVSWHVLQSYPFGRIPQHTRLHKAMMLAWADEYAPKDPNQVPPFMKPIKGAN